METVTIKRDGDLFVSTFIPLDIASQGTTSKEALEALADALYCFVATAHDNGVLVSILNKEYQEGNGN